MSGKIHPNHDHQNVVEPDSAHSILNTHQEETLFGPHALVTTLTINERVTERHVVTDEGNENSVPSNGIFANKNSSYQPDIRKSQAEQESCPFGPTNSSVCEALAISGGITGHRRERTAEPTAFPRNSRSYKDNSPVDGRHAQATSLTRLAHSCFLQTRMTLDPSQEHNIAITCNSNPGLAKYADDRKRLKSFRGYAKKWPHQNPSAENMARANFIFRGSDRHPDAVQCYLCGKTFHTIQETDVPDNLCECNL